MSELRLECTCGGCPTQYEGSLADGRSVYFRYRHGHWRLEFDGKEVLSGKHYGPGGSDGIMSDAGVRALVAAAMTIEEE